MKNKKIIAILGATGAQGGGLAEAILNDTEGEFQARAITRNRNSEKAQYLASIGAEVVEADVGDMASLEEAFKDAHGVYGVTFFWEHFSPETELAHAKNIAAAAKNAAVEHVIWSTLEDTRNWVALEDDRMPTLMDKYKVPHFDAKGEANEFFQELNLPTTYLYTSFYWDNFIHFGMGPKRGPNGKLSITFPMGEKKLPGISARDIGKTAYGIFKDGKEYIGKSIGIASEHLSGREMAAGLSHSLGEEVVYNAVPFDVYRGFGFPGAEDLGNMFQFKYEFSDDFCQKRNLETARELNPTIQSYNHWLSENAHRMPLN